METIPITNPKGFAIDLPMKIDLVPQELLYIILVIYGVLSLSSLVFWILKTRNSNNPLYEELVTRTNSWWYLATGVVVVMISPKIIGTVVVAFVSFVALREMFSISRFREADRTALVAAYLAIPIQYYLAYNMYYPQFLYFIPLVMFIALPFILVMTGNTSKVGRSMSLIPSVLLLTVYMLSHIVLLFELEVPGFALGSGALIIFLIILTSFNDVFQFMWGKLLGKHKILPTVSPNKTWEGFIGGVLTTAVLGYFLRFLTPLTGYEALATSLAIGILGFMGDSMISAIKRDLEIKDTSDLIPGHGGAMDRLDSLFITAPVYYHFLTFFIERS